MTVAWHPGERVPAPRPQWLRTPRFGGVARFRLAGILAGVAAFRSGGGRVDCWDGVPHERDLRRDPMAPTKNRSALFTWHALGTLKWYLLFCCLLPSLCVHVSMTCYKRVSLVFLVHNPNGQYTNLPKSSPKHTKSTKHIGNPASPTTTPLPPPQNRLRTTAAIKTPDANWPPPSSVVK